MHSKTYLVVALVLVLAMGMGCSSGSSSNGGGSSPTSGSSSSQTIVGTWKLVQSDYPGWPTQMAFNAGGTGQSPEGVFTWTQTGNQVTASWTGENHTWTYVLSPDGKTSTLNSQGSTAVYNRA